MIKKRTIKNEINLDGPEGNAFSLIGNANKIGKSLGLDKSELDVIVADMMSSDYTHLVKVFNKYFGEYVDIITNDEELLDSVDDTD